MQRFKWLLAAALTIASPGIDAKGSAQAKVEFRWKGAALCAAPNDPDAELQRLLKPEQLVASAVFEIEVAGTESAVRMTFRALDTARTSEDRVLELHSCGEAREVAVLLAAMSLDPSLKVGVETEAAEPEPTASDTQDNTVLVPWHVGVAAAGVIEDNLQPNIAGGADLGLWLGRRALRLGFHGRYLTSAATTEGLPSPAQARVQLGAIAFEFAGAWRWRKMLWGPATELEVGSLRVQMSGVPMARVSGARWIGIWGGLGAGLQVTDRTSISIRCLIGTALSPPRFALRGGAPFYVPNEIVGRVFLGVNLALGSTD